MINPWARGASFSSDGSDGNGTMSCRMNIQLGQISGKVGNSSNKTAMV